MQEGGRPAAAGKVKPERVEVWHRRRLWPRVQQTAARYEEEIIEHCKGARTRLPQRHCDRRAPQVRKRTRRGHHMQRRRLVTPCRTSMAAFKQNKYLSCARTPCKFRLTLESAANGGHDQSYMIEFTSMTCHTCTAQAS